MRSVEVMKVIQPSPPTLLLTQLANRGSDKVVLLKKLPISGEKISKKRKIRLSLQLVTYTPVWSGRKTHEADELAEKGAAKLAKENETKFEMLGREGIANGGTVKLSIVPKRLVEAIMDRYWCKIAKLARFFLGVLEGSGNT